MGLLDKLFRKGSDSRSSPQMILESPSPVCPLLAFVEQDNRTAYFYIVRTDTKDPATKVCWVRNTSSIEVSESVKSQMQEGQSPVVPRRHVSTNAECVPLDPARLSIVWFEEGDAAALLLDDSVLTVIPSWSGKNGFHGYSRDCATECEVCWPLSEDNYVLNRTKKAENFWKRSGAEDFWKNSQSYFLKQYENQFGKIDKYFSIDGGKWPPKALVSIPVESGTVFLTLGVSTLCQPAVELATDEPENFRRFELGFFASNDLDPVFIEQMLSYISGQTSLPWSNQTWLGNGHTLGCWALEALENTQLTAVLLSKELGPSNPVDLSVEGDPVNLLWMIPISDQERKYSISNGSKALLDLLIGGGVLPAFKTRASML